MSKTASTLDAVEEALAPATVATDLDGPAAKRRLSLPTWLKAGAPALTFIGVAIAVVGFVLILVAWGQVAGETQVYLQVPYLVSAGLTGLGLVMVGLTIVNVAAKQRDALDRDRQMDQLVSILGELKSTMTDSTSDKGRRR
jgi:uncharacterized membrane protein